MIERHIVLALAIVGGVLWALLLLLMAWWSRRNNPIDVDAPPQKD